MSRKLAQASTCTGRAAGAATQVSTLHDRGWSFDFFTCRYTYGQGVDGNVSMQVQLKPRISHYTYTSFNLSGQVCNLVQQHSHMGLQVLVSLICMFLLRHLYILLSLVGNNTCRGEDVM